MINREQMKNIVKRNIERSYINYLNCDNHWEWKNEIIKECVEKYYPEVIGKFNYTPGKCLSKLAIEVFEEMKPEIDWNEIMNNSWEEMRNKIDYRKNVEKDDYFDDLDSPLTSFFCYQMRDEVVRYGTNKQINGEMIDALTVLFMNIYEMSGGEGLKERVRVLIEKEMREK